MYVFMSVRVCVCLFLLVVVLFIEIYVSVRINLFQFLLVLIEESICASCNLIYFAKIINFYLKNSYQVTIFGSL